MKTRTDKVITEATDSKSLEADESLIDKELEQLLAQSGHYAAPDPEEPKELEEALEEETPQEESEDEDTDTAAGDTDTDTSESTDAADDAEEPAPISDRLKEFEQHLPPPEADGSLRGQLKQLETSVKQEEQALQSTNFLAGLPTDGIFQKDGKSIYAMDQTEVNDYIVSLQDEGHAFQAAQVQTNYLKAMDGATGYYQKLQAFQESQTKLRQASDYVDWQELKNEFSTKLPELTQKDYDALGQFIDSKAVKDPLYYEALSTKAGKLQKGVEALQALGILERLKGVKPKEESKQPSAPDAKTVSKKVKTKSNGVASYTNEQIFNMSQKEFNALPEDVINKMLAEGL